MDIMHNGIFQVQPYYVCVLLSHWGLCLLPIADVDGCDGVLGTVEGWSRKSVKVGRDCLKDSIHIVGTGVV